MDIKPTRGKILGKVLSDKTEENGVLVVRFSKDIPSRINVVAVGNPNTTKKGKNVKPFVHVGDIAHVKRYSGVPCSVGEEKFLFVKNDDIVARETKEGIHAVGDTILATLEYAEKQRTIIIPDQAKQYSGDFWGRVVAVGPEYRHQVTVGDRIRFTRNEGMKVFYGGREHLTLKHKWVVGVERD